MSGFHVNRPASITLRRVTYCPTCEQRRRFTGFDQLWYGPTWTCLGCGDSWSDGVRLQRPFARGWRDKARRKARDRWEGAVRHLGPEHLAWLDASMAPYLESDDPAEVA